MGPALGDTDVYLANESSLTYYDAAYLALAAMQNATLMTADSQAPEIALRMNLRVTLLR
jgi:predicted nucleic acid-binding protein